VHSDGEQSFIIGLQTRKNRYTPEIGCGMTGRLTRTHGPLCPAIGAQPADFSYVVALTEVSPHAAVRIYTDESPDSNRL
jgi:hypothetical protein